MVTFEPVNGVLHVEKLNLCHIAQRFGTPTYVYSRNAIEAAYQRYDRAFTKPHTIHYAVKANSNVAVLNVLARLGSGFDIVSVGELERVLVAGGDPARVVFSGVGKRAAEIIRALEVGIGCFNVESHAELELISKLSAQLGCVAPISIRVNPDVDAKTHPYISTGLHENKFGVSFDQALPLYERAQADANLNVVGIDCHIGSQLTDLSPFADALKKMIDYVDQLAARGIKMTTLDIGGGVGVRYDKEKTIDINQYAKMVEETIGDRELHIALEPGRSIVANAGALLTSVILKKTTPKKTFVVVDAAMNDLIRPALYQAWMDIVPVQVSTQPVETVDVVGPVCETGDFLGLERELNVGPDDLLIIKGAGAYGSSMSSNYNSRPKPAEVLVDGDHVWQIKPRQKLHELWADETCIP